MGIITDLSLKIKEIRAQLFFIFEFFIVGYYALFCIFDITFLDYDIVTRIIFSTVAAFLLHITHTCALCAFLCFVLKRCKGSSELKAQRKDPWAIPIVINLLLFTVITFLLYVSFLKILCLIILVQGVSGVIQGCIMKIIE